MLSKELAKKIIKKFDIKKAVSFAGTILMSVALIFVFLRLFDMRENLDFTILSNPWVLIALLLIMLLEGAFVILASINYRSIVMDISSVFVPFHTAVKIYNITNMYKFIPGGLMQVIGRNRLALETKNLGHGKVALSTLIEGILWPLAAMILSITFAFNYFIYYIHQLSTMLWLGLIAAFVIGVSVLIFKRFQIRLQEIIENIRRDSKKPLRTILTRHLLYMLIMVSFWGFSFLATLTVLGQSFTLSLGIVVAGLYILSWGLGYLTPGAPSGLGIREFVLLMSLGGILGEEILLQAIVVHRALQIVGDIVAYVMVMAYTRKGKERV